MTLDYGFCMYEYKNKERVQAERMRRYAALTEQQKEWLNTHPLWGGFTGLLMSTGVGHVSEMSIPVILERSKRLKLFRNPDHATYEMLKPYIGIEVNVIYETTHEFEKRHGLKKTKGTEMMTRAQAEADRKTMREPFFNAPTLKEKPLPEDVIKSIPERWSKLKVEEDADVGSR